MARLTSSRFKAATKAFLEALGNGDSVSNACRRSGVSRTLPYRWRDKGRAHPEGPYGEFTRAWDALESISATPKTQKPETVSGNGDKDTRVAVPPATPKFAAAAPKIYVALAVGKTRRQAAHDGGVSHSTLARWYADNRNGFREKIDQIEDEVLSLVQQRLLQEVRKGDKLTFERALKLAERLSPRWHPKQESKSTVAYQDDEPVKITFSIKDAGD